MVIFIWLLLLLAASFAPLAGCFVCSFGWLLRLLLWLAASFAPLLLRLCFVCSFAASLVLRLLVLWPTNYIYKRKKKKC